jgi:hypothetical protein
MEDPADLDAVVGVRVASPPGGDQEAVGPGAVVADDRVVVVGVAQDEACLGRHLVEQARGRLRDTQQRTSPQYHVFGIA